MVVRRQPVQQVPKTLPQRWSCITLCVVHDNIAHIQAPNAVDIVLLQKYRLVVI